MHGYGVFFYIAKACQDAHCGDDAFLGNESGDGGSNCLPCTKSQRDEDPCDGTADIGKEGSLGINKSEDTVLDAEGGKEPHHCTAKEQDGAGFLEECPGSFPDMHQDTFETRDMVSRQLHDKRCRITCKHL